MSTQIIPLSQLQQQVGLPTAGNALEALSAGIGGVDIRRISIKNSKFAVAEGGESTLLVDERGMPYPQINVVIVRASDTLHKTYFPMAYDPNSTDNTPTCWSMDAVTPATDAAQPQAANCASCPHNVFGSGTNGVGKRCGDRWTCLRGRSRTYASSLLR